MEELYQCMSNGAERKDVNDFPLFFFNVNSLRVLEQWFTTGGV